LWYRFSLKNLPLSRWSSSLSQAIIKLLSGIVGTNGM